jgi:MFS family permease
VAKGVFHGNAATYGFLTAAMGLGAVGGGLVVAARGKTGLRPFTIAVAVLGLAIALAALAPVLGIELAALVIVGYASVSFLATGNTTLQLTSEPSMRGRVMSLWAVAFLGTTPIGGPLLGWIIATSNGRVGLGVGAISCLVATAIGAVAIWRLARARADRADRAEGLGAPVEPQRTRKAISPIGASSTLRTDVTEA